MCSSDLSSGTMTVFAQDGSSMLVSAMEDEPERFTVEIRAPFGSTTFEGEWADGFLACPEAVDLYCEAGDDAS